MTDDPLGRDDASLDASDFLDWLDEMADAEGKSREELIQSLVSSYWTLDEMLNLMEQADPDADLPEAAGAADRGDARRGRRLADVEGDLAERIDELDDRLVSLRSELEDRPDGEALEDFRALVDSLADRVAAMETESGGGPDATEVEAVSDRVGALEERIDTEFGHLHSILEHLLDTTDDLEDRTAGLDASTSAELHEFLTATNRLVDLKRTAAQLGISKARCGYCDTKLRLALLPTPECPQCERHFVDIEPKQGWFGSATLVVSDRSSAPGPRPSGPRAGPGDDDRDDGTNTDGGSTSRDFGRGGFDWVGDD